VRALLEEVLALQPEWEAANTPAMARRGLLIRNEIPTWLRKQAPMLASAAGLDPVDFGAEGRDATGLKTEVPWVRVFSHARSPHATGGWYVVYLFAAEGDRLYLSVNQGTTLWTGTDFRPLPRELLTSRAAWARDVLREQAARPDLLAEIELGSRRSHLGRGYEAGNVLAIAYSRGTIPDETVLTSDAAYMCGLLGALYRAEEEAYVPGDPAPEVAYVVDAASRAAGRARRSDSGRQGFRLSAEERSTIERHGVARAKRYFEKLGWSAHYVGNRRPYDLSLTQGEATLAVEVKATTSRGDQVVVTRGEVAEQRRLEPANALAIVHSIELDRRVSPARASGGIIDLISPWRIEDGDLTVIAYVYTVPAADRRTVESSAEDGSG